jgi:transcriptional regulator with XRE-family HTH domain
MPIRTGADTPVDRSVADTLRRRREELGLSQEGIATQLGLTADFIGLCERGMRRVGLDRIPQLAQILEVNAKDLAMMALVEEAPQMADVLLQGKLSKNFDPGVMGSAEQESYQRLMSLPRNQRQPLLDTINALYDMQEHKKRRDGDKTNAKPSRATGGRR